MKPSILHLSSLCLVAVAVFSGACSSNDDPPATGQDDAGAGVDASGSNDDAGATADASNDASGEGDGALPTTEQGRYCKARVDHDLRCNPEQSPPGDPNCDTDSDVACFIALARPGTMDATSACLAARDCGTPDERCPETIGKDHKPFTDFATACLARQGECDGGGTTFKDDLCAQYTAIFEDSVLSAMNTCLAEPCGDIQACFLAAVRAGDPACAKVEF